MPTSNISVTSTWTKIADEADEGFLLTWDSPVTVEVASTSADAQPIIRGHKLRMNEAITREILGAGYVWAKLCSGSFPAAVSVVVTK